MKKVSRGENEAVSQGGDIWHVISSVAFPVIAKFIRTLSNTALLGLRMVCKASRSLVDQNTTEEHLVLSNKPPFCHPPPERPILEFWQACTSLTLSFHKDLATLSLPPAVDSRLDLFT